MDSAIAQHSRGGQAQVADQQVVAGVAVGLIGPEDGRGVFADHEPQAPVVLFDDAAAAVVVGWAMACSSRAICRGASRRISSIIAASGRCRQKRSGSSRRSKGTLIRCGLQVAE